MTHTITREDVTEWLSDNWVNFAASYGRAKNGNSTHKSFEVNANTKTFRVVDHGDVTYLGTDIDEAVAAYNEAP